MRQWDNRTTGQRDNPTMGQQNNGTTGQLEKLDIGKTDKAGQQDNDHRMAGQMHKAEEM